MAPSAKKYPSRGALELSFIIFWLSPMLNLLAVVHFIAKFCHFNPFGFAQGRLREKSWTDASGFLIPLSAGFEMT